MLNREQLKARIGHWIPWVALPLLAGLWAFDIVDGHRRVQACKAFCHGHGQWYYRPAARQSPGQCSCADRRKIASADL